MGLTPRSCVAVAISCIALSISFASASLIAPAQADTMSSTKGPSFVRLLPGYHYRNDGFDSYAGQIWKDNGLTLNFDVPIHSDSVGGGGASVSAEINNLKKEDLLWLKEQMVNGLLVRIALTKKRRILVVYPKTDAGFYGTVKTDQDVVDVLLMVLTYQRPLPYSPLMKDIHTAPNRKHKRIREE